MLCDRRCAPLSQRPRSSINKMVTRWRLISWSSSLSRCLYPQFTPFKPLRALPLPPFPRWHAGPVEVASASRKDQRQPLKAEGDRRLGDRQSTTLPLPLSWLFSVLKSTPVSTPGRDRRESLIWFRAAVHIKPTTLSLCPLLQFLQDTLDTLFGILDESSQRYGLKVFDSLVSELFFFFFFFTRQGQRDHARAKETENTRRLSEKDVTTSPQSGSAAPIERLIDGLSPSLASLRGADTSGSCSPFSAALSPMRSGRQLFLFVVFEISRMSPTGGRVLCGGHGKHGMYLCGHGSSCFVYRRSQKRLILRIQFFWGFTWIISLNTISSRRHVAQMCHIPN